MYIYQVIQRYGSVRMKFSQITYGNGEPLEEDGALTEHRKGLHGDEDRGLWTTCADQGKPDHMKREETTATQIQDDNIEFIVLIID